MIPQRLRRLSQAVLGGFLIGSSLIGYAQDASTPGIVRITDSRPQGVPIRNVGHRSHLIPGQYNQIGPVYGDGCPQAYGDCPDAACHHGHFHNKLGGLFHEHYGKLSPDAGYVVPGKYPIYRRGVQYNQYFPATWYGAPGTNIAPGQVYPTIYQPTDTTQMGFYYQHVPFWQPRPNMLPPRPIPAQWHNRNLVGGYGSGYGYGMSGAYCPPGAGSMGGSYQAPMGTPMNAQPMPIQNGTPQPLLEGAPPPPAQIPGAAPVPEDGPPPANDSARNLNIRRASAQR